MLQPGEPSAPTVDHTGCGTGCSDSQTCFEGLGEIWHVGVDVGSGGGSHVAKGSNDNRDDVSNDAIGLCSRVFASFEVVGSSLGFFMAVVDGSCGHDGDVERNA